MAKASDVRAGGAFVEIGGDLESLRGALRRGKRMMQNFGRNLMVGGGVMAGVGAAIAAPLYESLKFFGKQEQAEKKLEQMVRSTGQAAGFTARQLKDMAAQFQKVTSFGDEDIMNMQAILLSFKEIRGPEFQKATEAVMDLSVLLGTDLRSAAIQLGKALNDPERGLSMLRRSGISFTEQQRNQIATMWKAGKQAEAQQMILEELNSQFGGQARAEADTYAGAIKQVGNAYGDLKEVIGGAIKPSKEFMQSIVNTIVTIKNWIAGNQQLVQFLGVLSGALIVGGGAFMALGGAITLVMATSSGLAYAFVTVAAAIGAAALAVIGLRGKYESLDRFLNSAQKNIVDFFKGWRVGSQSMHGHFEIALNGLKTEWLEFEDWIFSKLDGFQQKFIDTFTKWPDFGAALKKAVWGKFSGARIIHDTYMGVVSGISKGIDYLKTQAAGMSASGGTGVIAQTASPALKAKPSVSREDQILARRAYSDYLSLADKVQLGVRDIAQKAKGIWSKFELSPEQKKAMQESLKMSNAQDQSKVAQKWRTYINKKKARNQLSQMLDGLTLQDMGGAENKNKTGIIGLLGGQSIAQQMGAIGRRTVEREQLDVMRHMDSQLEEIKRNTRSAIEATFA